MKTFYKDFKLLIAVSIIAVFSFVGTNKLFAQTSITAIGTTYSQNFNTLTSAGSWTDNSTITSWYSLDVTGSAPTSFILNDGEASSDGLTSFGTVANSDRALGFAPAGNIGDKMYVGWRFKNNTGNTINSLVISWTGEQWRDEDASAQSITLNYQISASAITTINAGLLENSSFEFQSPQNTGGSVKLNGNQAANRVVYTHTINDAIAAGSEVIIVWETTNLGLNHLMAIDDISVTGKTSQTITFNTPVTKTYGDASFNPGATATSGLTVSYSSSNTNVATVSGSTITIVGPGRATITASQAGNASFTPAPDVPRTLNVKPKVPVSSEATNITTTSFQANWTADNGANDGTTTYALEYATVKNFSVKTTKTSSSKFYNVTSLTPNTIYFYRIYALNTGNSSAYTEASAITTGTNYVTANAGNWDTGSNWDVGYINNVANSITVQHNINLNTLRDSVTTNTLIIRSTGKLTTNQKIHVTNQLIIEVDASGNSGQILNTANIHIGYNAKIIVRKSFTANQWNFMGFPFNVSSSSVYAQGGSTALTWADYGGSGDYVVQEYSGSQRNSTGQANTTGAGLNWINVPGHEFVAKKGYIIASPTNRVIDFTLRGANKADIFSLAGSTASLGQYTSNSFAGHHSWNLVTTPYLSSFELASTTINAPYYAYNGVNYTTKLSGESLVVPPFRSFFLQASASSISFANAGKRINAPAVKGVDGQFDEVYLNLSNGNNLYDDLARIRLQEGASADYVIGTDAAKMFGMDPNVSYIYSTINGYGIAINTLPATTSNVELQTKFAATGNYTISISNTDKISNYSAVILYDKVLGKNVDLLSVGSYTFSSSLTGTTNRFTVKLSPKITTGISQSENGKITISSVGNNITVKGLSAVANIAVYDMSGKIAFKGLVENNQNIRLENKGLYVFEISDNNIKENIKVFIK